MKRIVIKVPTNDDPKRRFRALRTACRITGIVSAALEGKDKDQLVVVGDLDLVKVMSLLRRKMGHAELISGGPARVNIEKKDKEGGGEKKDKGGGGKGGGGSEKKDKPDDSDKKDKPDDSDKKDNDDKKDNEGGGRAGEKNDKVNGELRKMGANKVYCGMFTYGPGTCAEATRTKARRIGC